ncbi:hypothetical protein [Actinomadura sp. NEAU-AAG7]|uniref:hypothetical protein n=1 Tax=Actinomadura sp. NEAU-AAG7 TaxID=2839640 RepID=UPI001BE4749B|nr:hypothetical protein [Actinomadura sp. NEAU-AAG7]MBT2207025.1 hypothetical protein [Actinomadura sp. NEAU-AAG7]
MARVPAPLPPVHEDDDFQAALEIQQRYPVELAAARGAYGLTQLQMAERINTLWTGATADLDRLREAFNRRYGGRWQQLWQMVPTGPEAPQGASPADKAVLVTAYRTARAAVDNEPDGEKLVAMLAEADRFGDEATRRAVLDHLRDEGHLDPVHAWAAEHIGAAWVDQIAYLTGVLFGATSDAMLAQQAFKALQRPHEVASLTTLRQREEEARRRHEEQQRRLNPASTRAPAPGPGPLGEMGF